MGSKSDYLEKKLLDQVLGGQAYAPPATVHLALFLVDGDVAPDVTEAGVSGASEVPTTGGTGYTRLAIPNTLAERPAASGSPSRKTNASLKLFPTAQADWGVVGEWALMDAATGGNVLYYGEFTRKREILAGDTATVAAGTVDITED